MKIKFSPHLLDLDLSQPSPTPASRHIPAWYKKMPQFTDESTKPHLIPGTSVGNSTVKLCTPFLDAMTSGYTFYLPVDIEVQRGNDLTPTLLWRTRDELVTTHTMDQYNGLPIPEGYDIIVFKWSNFWGINTPKGYSSMFMHPVNRFDLPFLTITGVVDTDEYNPAVQFPFFIKKTFSGIIPAGTPIVQIFPFKRDNWEKQEELYDERKSKATIKKLLSKAVRSYKSQYWSKKTYV